jgi:hypothetical protein
MISSMKSLKLGTEETSCLSEPIDIEILMPGGRIRILSNRGSTVRI